MNIAKELIAENQHTKAAFGDLGNCKLTELFLTYKRNLMGTGQIIKNY